MRLCFYDDGRLGVVEGEVIRDATVALDALPSARYPFPRHDLLVAALPDLRDRIAEAAARGAETPVAGARLHAPVANPGKIIAAPVNYMRHFEEALADPATFAAAHVRKIQETGLFLKATSSVVGPATPVRLRHPDRRTDHEVELAVIIGRPGSDIPRERAMDHVAGYAIGLDITLRGPEERSLRKSPDTYTVLGPWMVTVDELGDPSALTLELDVDGPDGGTEARQRANTRDLVLDIPALIVLASSFYTLHPGDVLLTGTPEGVGPITPGAVMRARIEGIGEMRVAVEAA